jgi:hypothetical protein
MANTSSLDDRIRRYTDRLIPERVKEDLTAQKSFMVNKLAERTTELITIEDRVKAVLATKDATTSDYPKYHTFARQVYKLQRRFGGGIGLNDEVALLVAKWKARGCTEAVLIAVRDAVFSIPAPAAP